MRLVAAFFAILLPCDAFAEIREFDFKTTQRLGNELIRLSKRPDRGCNTPERKRARQTAIAALGGRLYDEMRYDYVVLDDPAGHGLLVYALALGKKKGDANLGGHFRVMVSDDGAVAQRVDLLSQLIKQQKPHGGKEFAAFVVGQVEANRPVETWLYTSYLYHLPIFVAVADGTFWRIENGRTMEADEMGRPKNRPGSSSKKGKESSQR
jgi:hypothetical protein